MAELEAEYMFRGVKVQRESTLVDGKAVHRWRGRVRINSGTWMSVPGDTKAEIEAKISQCLARAHTT
jgi:hypothetical protein